jgi:hypothetical protein
MATGLHLPTRHKTALMPNNASCNGQGLHIPVQPNLTVLTQDTNVHGVGMQVDAAVQWVLRGMWRRGLNGRGVSGNRHPYRDHRRRMNTSHVRSVQVRVVR